jgi:acyl-CoA dehydrogenase
VAGCDVKGIRTTASREGDGYVLNCAKIFITNGVQVDLYCIAAVSSLDARPSQRMSIFFVEKYVRFRGWSCTRQAGLAIIRHGGVAVRGLPDPRDEPARRGGTRLLREHVELQNERIGIDAKAMGEAQAAIEITLDWMAQRQTFGAPLWSIQAIVIGWRCWRPRSRQDRSLFITRHGW